VIIAFLIRKRHKRLGLLVYLIYVECVMKIQDQNVCTYYSRYGICKFGPACKFDHPPPSTMSGLDQQSSYTHSASVDVAENGGVSDGNQQSL